MWKIQIMLGEKVNHILINKFKNLSLKLILLQALEALFFILLARKSVNFNMNSEMLLRFLLVNLSALIINLFFLGFLMIVEMKSKKVYTLSFISIIGGLTGIITMLTSKVLSFINPFAWMASLLNVSYVIENQNFVQVLNPINFYTIIIAFAFLVLMIIYIKTMKSYNLWKD